MGNSFERRASLCTYTFKVLIDVSCVYSVNVILNRVLVCRAKDRIYSHLANVIAELQLVTASISQCCSCPRSGV